MHLIYVQQKLFDDVALNLLPYLLIHAFLNFANLKHDQNTILRTKVKKESK